MGYIGKLHCLRLRSIFHSPSSCSFLVMLCLVSQSCPTLCDPRECSPPGSSVGILQARILEWVAMPSSKGSS